MDIQIPQQPTASRGPSKSLLVVVGIVAVLLIVVKVGTLGMDKINVSFNDSSAAAPGDLSVKVSMEHNRTIPTSPKLSFGVSGSRSRGPYTLTVEFGDGTQEQYSGVFVYSTTLNQQWVRTTHAYPSVSTYTVVARLDFTGDPSLANNTKRYTIDLTPLPDAYYNFGGLGGPSPTGTTPVTPSLTPLVPSPSSTPTNGGAISPDTLQNFELSAWVDIGLKQSTRGYWYSPSTLSPDTPPTATEITNAKRVLRTSYHTNQLYLVYQRQFEPATAKEVMLTWKNATISGTYAQSLIPTIVLQNYGDDGCNFTDDELRDLIPWIKSNINSKAIALFDIYNTSTNTKRNFCNQASLIKSLHGGELIRVGLQPLEPLVSPFTRAVEDTYSAVATGNTNTLWQTSCGVYGKKTGKDGLISWVDERIVQKKRVAWDLVIVAFDYALNPPCGADALTRDDPLPAGRNGLARDTMISRYSGGTANALWTGMSFDFGIINSYAAVPDRKTDSIYSTLRAGTPYQGYYAIPLNEAASIFDQYDN